MKRLLSRAGLAVAGILMVGCSSAPASYESIDLRQDLGKGGLDRYQGEWTAAGGGASAEPWTNLEYSNGWPLGLLAYWDKGAVRAQGKEGSLSHYTVTRAQGFGPLSLLYAYQEDAMFHGDGRRRSYMSTHNILWGHLAMIHVMDMAPGEAHCGDHWAAMIFHHLIAFGRGHGGAFFSIGGYPNPMTIGD